MKTLVLIIGTAVLLAACSTGVPLIEDQKATQFGNVGGDHDARPIQLPEPPEDKRSTCCPEVEPPEER